jgi:hypothetical protein
VDSIKPLMSLVDTLHLGLYLNAFKLTEEEFKELESAKQWMRENALSERLIDFRGKLFHITGAKKIYAYVLYNDDLTVKIARKLSGGAYPEVFIEFRSRLLLAGLQDAYNAVMEWVGKWADVKCEKVSRADLTTDFEGVLNISINNVVMRCRKNAEHYDSVEVHRNGRRLTGYAFGAGDLMLRIYDKTREIEEKKKDYVKAEWLKKGWDEQKPVWRIEGQLRRHLLKEFNVESVTDLMSNAPDIWRYITSEWFTVRKPSETDTTRSRWAFSEMWEVVRNSFHNFGNLSGVVREKIKQVSLRNIMPQVAGLLTSCYALIDRDSLKFKEVLGMVGRYYRSRGLRMKQVIQDKKRAYALFEESLKALQGG